jgi:serine/threonine protein kinase
LDKIVGRGGMGVVWLGFDPQLNRRVAIKTVRPEFMLRANALTLFLDEARRLAGLSHPGILPVYDCGSDDGICYLVSEYVPGGTLASYLKQGPLSFARIAEIVAHVADAAHHAHLRGIVHRDIKPGNILLREDGKPLLADFGLAIAEDEQLRETPGTLGTYGYMAPEQMLDQSRFVDGRADVYSLGVVLYQMLTGRLPYVAKTAAEYRELALHRDPRPPRSVREDIPPALEAICLKCLARRPVDRYSTAGDLAVALRSARNSKSARKTWLLAAAAAVLLLSLPIARWFLPAQRIAEHQLPEQPPPRAPVLAAPALPNETRVPTGHVVRVSELKISSSSKVNWGVKDRGEALWFLSDDLVLFQLGDYGEGDLQFSVELEQSSWSGGLGIFWGYSDCPDQPGWKQYEFLQLRESSGQRPELIAAHRMYNVAARQLSSTTEYATHPIAALHGPTHRIGFTFRQGELTALQWDNEELSSILPKRLQRNSAPLPPRGTFGLLNNRSHGTYLRPFINGELRHFEP